VTTETTMAFGDAFRSAYGRGEQYRSFGLADRSRLEGIVPPFLLELWDTDGWAGYRDGLLWTVDPQQFEPIVALWNLPGAPVAMVARTAFGTLYMLRRFEIEGGGTGVAVVSLDPHTGDYKVVGPTAERFLTKRLADRAYIENVLGEPAVKRAARDVGPLAWDEMYGYEPALALGGSGTPETVRRYKLPEHQLLLSQLVEAKVRLL